jgi:hypothetical protein
MLKDGQLRLGAWGFLEMKIAAAYLRLIPITQIDAKPDSNGNINFYGHDNQSNQVPRLLKTGFYNDQGKECSGDECVNFGFELYLLKPKLAIVVVCDESKTMKLPENLQGNGMDVVHKVDPSFQDVIKYGTRHKFKVLLDPDENTIKEAHKSNQRTITIRNESPQTFIDRLQSKNRDEIALELFQVMRFVPPTFTLKPVSNGNQQNINIQSDLICDDHGSCITTDNGFRPSGCFYYEPYSSQSATHKLLHEKMAWINEEIKCAALTQVVIIDERIQKGANTSEMEYTSVPGTVRRRFKVREVLRWMKVRVPDPAVVDLNEQHYSERTMKNLERWIEKTAKVHFLVIHLGVIEKTVGTHPDSIASWIKNHETDSRFVIVISGRGRPSNLPEETLYLPFSLVEQYTIPNVSRSKVYLYRLLSAARRR